MARLTTRQLNQILKIIDYSNAFDLESFTEALKRINHISNQMIIDNIVDYLVFDLEISSDSDLKKLGQNDFKKIISTINRIKIESWCLHESIL